MSSQTHDAQPVHPRVLEVGLEHHQEWAIACWFDPGPDALEEQLRRLLEVTLLAEYSQRPSLDLLERDFRAVELLVFDALSPDSEQVLGELGFSSTAYVADNYAERMSAWRQEAGEAGLEVGSSPEAVFKAEIARPGASISSKLEQIQRQMVDKLDGEVFGETPGGPSKLMAGYFRQHFNVTVTPDRKGLHAFELFLVQEQPSTLRWMPPVLFQSLCDFLGVLLQAEYGINVQWGLSTPDTSGLAPPPVMRMPAAHVSQVPDAQVLQVPDAQDSFRQIPVGEFIVRSCVMPEAKDAPSLAARIDELVEDLHAS